MATKKAHPPEVHELRDEMEQLEREIDSMTFDAWKLEPGAAEARARAPQAPLAFKHLLVAVDGSEGSEYAVAWAKALAPVFKAQVTLVSVAVPPDVATHYLDVLGTYGYAGPSDLFKESEAWAQTAVEKASRNLADAGIVAEAQVAYGFPVKEIVALAAARGCDLVLLGGAGRSGFARLLGSVADGVKDHTSANVLLARGPPPPRRLLAATDGSRASKRAAALTLRLSKAWRVPATVCHVFWPGDTLGKGELDTLSKRAFGGLRQVWTEPKPQFDLEWGHPAARILEVARQQQAGLVVLGSRGLSGLRSIVAGSVSNRVAREASASVLLVKEDSG